MCSNDSIVYSRTWRLGFKQMYSKNIKINTGRVFHLVCTCISFYVVSFILILITCCCFAMLLFYVFRFTVKSTGSALQRLISFTVSWCLSHIYKSPGTFTNPQAQQTPMFHNSAKLYLNICKLGQGSQKRIFVVKSRSGKQTSILGRIKHRYKSLIVQPFLKGCDTNNKPNRYTG